ncbi:hypothetical protein IWW50_003618 [Coemansia erecta]|nr:hypothetical protein GGF43_001455 [Coemansia sp. RSA 2618]KAJ2823817.1 hypothetical protein IWW50_003618 [Coemansia erecta]
MTLAHSTKSSQYVKTLVIAHTAMHSAHDLLMGVNHALSLRQSPWPSIRRIRISSHFATHLLSTRTLDGFEAKYIADVASVVQHAIPTLQALDISTIRADAAIHRLSALLAHRYIAQLDHFIYTGRPFDTDPHYAQQLKSLYLYFTNGHISPSFVVNPTHLSSMHLNNVAADYDWHNFICTRGQIVFENLTHLTLSNTGLNSLLASSNDAEQSAPSVALVFPRLVRLTLGGTCLGKRLLESVLRPPLKCLEISWWLLDFRCLEIADLKFLDTLKIWYNLNSDTSASDGNPDFFAVSNSIFTMTRGIRFVQLSLYTTAESIQWSQAQWPYLTSLHLDLTTTLQYLFKIACQFAELKQLKIGRLRMPTKEECADPETYLQALKQKLRPSVSKIEILLIEFRPPFSPGYLDENIAMLGWYLPRLSRLRIPSS